MIRALLCRLLGGLPPTPAQDYARTRRLLAGRGYSGSVHGGIVELLREHDHHRTEAARLACYAPRPLAWDDRDRVSTAPAIAGGQIYARVSLAEGNEWQASVWVQGGERHALAPGYRVAHSLHASRDEAKASATRMAREVVYGR